MKMHTRSLLWLTFALLSLACSTSHQSREAAEASAAAEKEAAQTKLLSESIHVECSVYRVGGGEDSITSCRKIDFALETTDEEEVARANPNELGTIDFPAAADKAYRVIPKVPSAWTIEVIPPTELHRGDSVRVVLRR